MQTASRGCRTQRTVRRRRCCRPVSSAPPQLGKEVQVGKRQDPDGIGSKCLGIGALRANAEIFRLIAQVQVIGLDGKEVDGAKSQEGLPRDAIGIEIEAVPKHIVQIALAYPCAYVNAVRCLHRRPCKHEYACQ